MACQTAARGADDEAGGRDLRLHSRHGPGRSGLATATSSPPPSATNATASSAAFRRQRREAAAGFHGGSRNETRYCVVCHTEQRKYGRTEATIDAATLTFTSSTERVDDRAVGNLPNSIHQTHWAACWHKKNYNYGGVLFNEVSYPQDLAQLHQVPRRFRHVDRQDRAGRQLEERAQPPGLRRLPRRHQLRDRHGRDAADAAKGLTSTQLRRLAHGGTRNRRLAVALCHSARRPTIDWCTCR